MTWVKQKPTVSAHRCTPPTRERVFRVPGSDIGHTEHEPDGEFGDLWRCDRCRTLWRIGNACDYCDPREPGNLRSSQGRHPGLVHGAVKTKWRHATWLQRFFYDGK